ncbi:MAG: phycobiliprotein lyase [Acaryochloridaceae cyanobacterium SU_2_1]|nr:phycobiliprotein lyase [Acaryochloridaceae cyanobacterium SU_2_1]
MSYDEISPDEWHSLLTHAHEYSGFFKVQLRELFVQRTCHPLGSFASQAQSADLQVEPVKLTDQAVIQLCESAQVDPTQVLTATQLSWQGKLFSLSLVSMDHCCWYQYHSSSLGSRANS